MDKCPIVELGVQRYPPEWKKNGHVSDSRIRGTWCPLEKKQKERERERERETEKKERKKMIAHGPSNKQYAIKR